MRDGGSSFLRLRLLVGLLRRGFRSGFCSRLRGRFGAIRVRYDDG